MPSINTPNLTLTTTGANTTVAVTYNAVFNPFERFLAASGLVFQERIRVLGMDPAGSDTGTILHNFAAQNIAVSAGTTALTVARSRTLPVPRASLQEDAAPGDSDEIRCQIEIVPLGLPATVIGFTGQETLVG